MDWGDFTLQHRRFTNMGMVSTLPYPICITEVSAPPRAGQGLFKCPVLLLSLSGTGTLKVNGKTYELPPGAAALAEPCDPVILNYENRSEKKWHLLEMLFSPGSPLTVAALNNIYGVVMHPSEPEKLAGLLRKHFSKDGNSDNNILSGACMVMTILNTLFAGASRRSAPNPDLAHRIKHLIEADVSGIASVKELAAENRVSVAHMERLFKAEFGYTISSGVRMTRIELAGAMLKNTDLSCKEIAAKVGFDHLSSFYRAFKQITGRTAGSVRRNRN